MYKCAAQARARKKKENVYAASVECTLMDTTRLSQRRPRRPLLAQHLSCHYPRPVGSRTRPMVPFRAKGRVEVASSLSLLHRSIGEPSPPLPPLIPPIPLCSSSYNPSPPPSQVYDAPDGRARFSASHTTSLVVPRRRIHQGRKKGSRPFAPKRPRCTPRGRSWGHLDLG